MDTKQGTNKKNSLLIVDDDTSNLVELVHILQSDYTVYTAKDGESAINRAKKSLPDLMLLDIHLPDFDGFEVCKLIKDSETTKSITIIFTTGASDNESERAALSAGAVDYIRKPFDETIVKQRVRNQIQIINLKKELIETIQKSSDTEATKAKLFTHLSSEIKTSTNTIIGVSELLKQHKDLPRDIMRGLDKMHQSCEYLQKVVDETILSATEIRTVSTLPSEEKIEYDPMPYGKVLVVDDFETNLHIAKGLMKLYRLQIDIVKSGREAIQVIEDGNVYDVIFMDYLMTGMNGIEATKHIRSIGYKHPIVALTANAAIEQAEVFFGEGFDDFISKPIDIKQLNLVLNRLIRDKQPTEVIEAARQKKYVDGVLDNETLTNTLLKESFIRDATYAIETIESVIYNGWREKEENLKIFIIAVHGVKNSLNCIGEVELGEKANTLEIAGRSNDFEKIEKETKGLLTGIKFILDSFESEKGDDVEDDIGELQTILKRIRKMCMDYDRKGIIDSIHNIKKASFESKETFDIIKNHVLHSEYAEAEAVANSFLTELSQRAEDLSRNKLISQYLQQKKIQGIDIVGGLERYDKDENVYLRILKSYVTSISIMLESIHDVTVETIDEYRINVHGIKGASQDILAHEIACAAELLENAAKANDLKYINTHNKDLLVLIRNFANEYKNVISEINKKYPKPTHKRPNKDCLKKILDACKNYDLNQIDTEMTKLERYEYKIDNDLVEWLRINVDMVRFKQIVEKLSEYVL
jgi:CheY-like chemotaxis protein